MNITNTSTTNMWGKENSEHNLGSDQYDLEYLILYISVGGHPADADMTNENALEWMLGRQHRFRFLVYRFRPEPGRSNQPLDFSAPLTSHAIQKTC